MTDERAEWVVVHSSLPLSDVVAGLTRVVDSKTSSARAMSVPSILEHLTSRIEADLTAVERDLVLDNLSARVAYLNKVPILTAGQIHDLSGSSARNRSEPASRWRNEGKTFGMRVNGRYLHPAFQFSKGRPRAAVKEILAALPNDMTAWQKALWFASGNGWLDGDSPEQCLDNVSSVTAAARQLSNLANG